MTRRRDAAAARIGWALGAGAALVAMAFYARRAVRQAGHAEMAGNALLVRQAMQSRCALEARAIDHDLRSPVGSMALALELLRTTDDPATHREVADVLERQISRMTTLTERVHELAQALAD